MAGTSADPRHESYIVSPETVREAGATWARSVITPDHDMAAWVLDCARLGIEVLPVVARETFVDWDPGWEYERYAEAASDLYAQYGAVFTMLQVMNEPDLQSESSWTLDPEIVNLVLRAFRQAWPGTFIVGPGLASHPQHAAQFADRLDSSNFDVYAVHCYGLMPDTWPLDPYGAWVRDFMQFFNHLSKPIWITEYGGKRSEFRDEATRGAYYRALEANLLAHPKVNRVCSFCLDRAMHPEYGIRDHGDEIPGWNDLPPQYVPGGIMPGPNPVLGNPWGSDGPVTIPTADGRQIVIEGYDYGITYTGPDGASWSLPHVDPDPNGDPNVIVVAGHTFRRDG